MTNENLDRILAEEEQLVPSSGFLAAVMESVTAEAAAPPPIPFPWKRAVPGMVLVTGVLGWGAVELVRHAGAAIGQVSLEMPHLSTGLARGLERPLEQAGWVALALGVSLASWFFARKMAGESGLM